MAHFELALRTCARVYLQHATKLELTGNPILIVQWKVENLQTFSATFNGVALVLSEDADGKWRITADGKPCKGWFMTSKTAKESVERIAENVVRANMALAPKAEPRVNVTVVARGVVTGRYSSKSRPSKSSTLKVRK